MESLAWSQAISSRSPLQPATGSSQLNLIASLDFAAMLSVADGSLTAPSVANAEYLVGSSHYQSWQSESDDHSDADRSDSLQSESASERAQADHETDEPGKSEEEKEESESSSTDIASKSQSSPIESAKPPLQPQLDVAVSQEAIAGPSNEAKPTDIESPGYDLEKSVSKSEFQKHPDPRTDDSRIEAQTDSQEGDLTAQSPTTATNVVSEEDVVQTVPNDESNTPDLVANSSVSTNKSESALNSANVSAYDETLELAPSFDRPISADEYTQGLTFNQDSSDQPRDTRGVTSRKGKSTRWFQRTESEQAQKASQDTAHELANQLDLAGQRMQAGLTDKYSNLMGTIHTTDFGQGPLTQADLLASVPAGLLPSQFLQDLPAAVAQSLSSLTQGTVVTSAASTGSEASTIALHSLSSSPGTEVHHSELGAMERLQLGTNSSAADTISSGDGLATSKITSEATSNLVRAERFRMIQRVARSFQRLGNAGGTVQLRLHPPELGSLSMQVQIDGRSMAAQLTTESAAARDVIMDSLPQLRSRLAEQGYEVTQINVDVADSSSNGAQSQWTSSSSSQTGQDESSQDYRGAASDLRRSAYLRRQLDSSLPTTTSTLPQAVSGNRGIDLHA